MKGGVGLVETAEEQFSSGTKIRPAALTEGTCFIMKTIAVEHSLWKPARLLRASPRRMRAVVLGWLFASLAMHAADFTVTTPEAQFAFNINGVNGPTLTLVRGRTYTFGVATTAGFHPFHIQSPGVDINDIDTGTITYAVPTNDANYFYNCTVHGDLMRGEIVTVPPPAPPTIRILSLLVDTNLVVTSTGTNNWTVNPEFNTNLIGTNWFALTVQTNRFFNGTNETICGRPPGNAVFIRIRAQQN